MKTIRGLLKNKGNEVYSINPDATVYEALSLMADKKIGALIVMEGDRVVGVLSERDYARKVILEGRSSEGTRVKEIMTTRVLFSSPDRSIEECMAMMTDQRIRHLPIMEDERLVGVISIGDLVKAIIAEQQFLIDQMERYIAG